MADYRIGNENVTVRDRRNSDYWADVNQMYEQAQLDTKLAQYQYDMNLEQWNRENAYNTPSEQMQRLKAAGLNPNLAYDNLSNTAASSPEMQKATANLSHGNYNFNREQRNLQAVSIANDMRFQNAQIDNLNQTNKLIQLQGLNQAIQNNKEMAGSSYWSKNAQFQSDALRLENDKIAQDINESQWRISEGTLNNRASREKIYNEIGLNEANRKYAEYNLQYLKNKNQREAFMLSLSSYETMSKVEVNKNTIQRMRQEIANMSQQEVKQKLDNEYFSTYYPMELVLQNGQIDLQGVELMWKNDDYKSMIYNRYYSPKDQVNRYNEGFNQFHEVKDRNYLYGRRNPPYTKFQRYLKF